LLKRRPNLLCTADCSTALTS